VIRGRTITLNVIGENDLERLVTHHELTVISIPSVGLEFESERTANMEMSVAMLLALAEQDIRENAQQIQTESPNEDDTRGGLSEFFSKLEGLRTTFPWAFVLKCPMSRATIEEAGDADPQLAVEQFIVPPEQMERVQAAFAEIFFDEQDKAEEEAAAAAAAAAAASQGQ
jgi:C4-type Zn-finger protein